MKKPLTITVVGGHGRMGTMFRDSWSELGLTVHAVDRKPGASSLDDGDIEAVVPGSDVVVLSVPAPAVPEVMDALLPYLRDGQILVDVCSVKTLPMRWIQDRFSGPVVGAHPFFGPGNPREFWRVALVPGDRAGEAECAVIAGLFQTIGCETFFTTAGEHDRKAAISQSLHFVLSAAYFATAAREKDLAPYLTPSFRRYMEAARKELTVNAAMFAEFTTANPLFPAVLTATCRLLEDAGTRNLNALVAEAGTWYQNPP